MVTLKDAGEYIAKLPKAEHTATEWQTANGSIASSGARRSTMLARIDILKALNRHVVREFKTSEKKTHWGNRKLARDHTHYGGS